MIIAYLAHPVGPDSTPAEVEARDLNIQSALGWLRWLVDSTTWAISAPWLPYVMRLSESQRDRGMRDNFATLERCDLVVLTGGRVSPGMELERHHAFSCGMPVVDLTSLGARAPRDVVNHANAPAFMTYPYRSESSIAGRTRRVWVPPISADTLDSLKVARFQLRLATQNDPDFNAAAGEFLDRLIIAASERLT